MPHRRSAPGERWGRRTGARAGDPLENRIVCEGFRGTWWRLDPPPLERRTVVQADGQLAALTAARAHLGSPGELLIVARERVDETLFKELRRFSEGRPGRPGRIWLTTSGSAGRPRLLAHTLSSLTTLSAPPPPHRWLLPYSPGTYAWWQLVALSLAHPGQDLVTAPGPRPDQWLPVALAEGVDAVSATPSFWRLALASADPGLDRFQPRQITLGGEPVDQPLLDRLRGVFPGARLSWIYASTEAGACVVVHDGKAGFPVEWLERTDVTKPGLRVRDGQLYVRPVHGADGVPEWIATSDRAEFVGGRVVLSGRIGQDQLNVGGLRLSAGQVRDVLLAHPEVHWARVFARTAPFVGSVVAAEVVSDASEGELVNWCTNRLPGHAVPRFFTALDTVPLTTTLKSQPDKAARGNG
ncbi:MAG TPA: AMP-binding protein [Streptomyces sp.]